MDVLLVHIYCTVGVYAYYIVGFKKSMVLEIIRFGIRSKLLVVANY